ncbi:MAG TPA: hypothetical protein VGM11_15065 [Acidobacteriaceae bacterium]|jgi:hypothetical protein
MNNASRVFSRRVLSAIAVLTPVVASVPAVAQKTTYDFGERFYPNNIVISRSVYDNNPSNVVVGVTQLPPNCQLTTVGCPTPAVAQYNGTYPTVFNNDVNDSSFGITSKIFLDQFSLAGSRLNSIEVPNSDEQLNGKDDQLVTSFSSKSELALNLSTSGKYLSFMGYVAPANSVDVSNSNTPLVVDPTNPVGINHYRGVALVDQSGQFKFTETNAYSGNNGRAAIYNDDVDAFYTAGNAGNGNNPQPNGVILGAGAQFVPEVNTPEKNQNPGTPEPLASFSVTELGDKADKVGKDTNFRGLTVFNNVVYLTKGSGSNGVNTVYFVDTTGKACPNGVGLPVAGAPLPAGPLSYDANTVQSGLPNNMCILAGFPTALAKSLPAVEPAGTNSYPFGVWFANKDTLYVADEGDGYNGTVASADMYKHAAAQLSAGLQKWVFNSTTNTWQFAYVIQKGLNLGVPYTVAGYPTGNNAVTGLPWAPATDGLRNITGVVGPDGLAAIWGVTSTVSGNGDQGADPNKVVVVVDRVASTTLPAGTSFTEFDTARFGEVLRGVSFTPGSDKSRVELPF